MTQFGFETQACAPSAANDENRKVSSAVGGATRPTLVTLESGIQALIEIAGFTYIEGVPLAIGAHLTENVDPADLVERGPDGIRFKGVSAPAQAGPIDVESHRSNVLCWPQEG